MLTLKTYLLIITLVKLSHSQETTTTGVTITATASINVTDTPINNTESKSNISMVRIIQPSSNIKTFSSSTSSPVKNDTKTFIPSPQLESYIEYNKYPVTPAFPESKQVFSQFSYIPPRGQAQDKKGFLGMTQAHMKPLKPMYGVPDISITTTERTVYTAQDKQLYPTRTDSDFPSFKYYERFNYPGPSSVPNNLFPSLPSVGWYNKLMFPQKIPQVSVSHHPYPFVTDLVRKEAPSITIPKGMSDYGKMSSWKRAAKIFAAILPIGLLISALTPTILTIGPVNATANQQCRKLAGRAESLGIDKTLVEKWSKPGCEARLLCETTIREDKFDHETVKKLFWSFVSQNAEDSETAEELESVSNAIKEKDCSEILCRDIKKKSTRDIV